MKRTIASVLVAIMTILCIGGYSESDALNDGIEAEEIILDQLPEPEQESEEDMATGDKLVNLDDLKVTYDKQQEDTNSLKSALNVMNDIGNLDLFYGDAVFYNGYYNSTPEYTGDGTRVYPPFSGWNTLIVHVIKGEQITISGFQNAAGTNSVWLNSKNLTDINSIAWNSSNINGEKTCVTEWLAICSYKVDPSAVSIKYKMRDSLLQAISSVKNYVDALKKDQLDECAYISEISKVDEWKYFHCKEGDKVTIKTKDGSNFTTTRLEMERSDRTKEFWTLSTSDNNRTIIIESGEEFFKVAFVNGTNQEIVIINNSSLYNTIIKNSLEELEDRLNDNIDDVSERLSEEIAALRTIGFESYDATISQKILISDTDKHVFIVKKGESFTVDKEDGTAVTGQNVLRFLDYDGNYIEYWTINQYRTIINDTQKDLAYCYFVSIDGSQTFRLRKTSTIDKELTDIDNRLNALEEKIPSFYTNYLKSRITDIQTNDLLVGNHGDSFIFITDLHNQTNYYSPLLAKDIVKNTGVKMLVYGGDYINEPNGSKSEVASMLFERASKFSIIDNTILLVGNHDTNPYGTNHISQSELYSILYKQTEKEINTHGKTYFYKDNVSQKIRYIFLDSGEQGVLDNDQLSWLKTSGEELDSDWTIVIFAHFGLNHSGYDSRIAIRYGTVAQVQTALSNISCKIAAYVSGHTHIDLEDTTGAYPIICTTCDANGAQASSESSDDRTTGTVNEQAFDVFHIDTTNKKVYVTRIGGGEHNVTEGVDYTLNDREYSYE